MPANILDMNNLITAYFATGHYGIYRAELVCSDLCQYLIDNELAKVRFYQREWGQEGIVDVVEISAIQK